ncbi:MAG: PIF1 family ATP-dependent DNA helicase [Proteobacteria bacterium]|nr:PIF1 family ATP-dependent DNA helicase [Pseudomonadota bacterium]
MIKLDTGTELPENFVLTKEFKEIFEIIDNTNSNLFITGKAGSGKSTLLEYFRQNTKKNYATLAFQGITAIKAKGQTIHSFFKFPPHFISEDDVDTLKDKEVIQKLDTILIDEISMVRADLFDAMDLSLRKNRKSDKPFGGVQIILIGDVMQIEPIVGSKEEDVMEKFYPDGPFFFNSKSYDKKDFKQLELTKIFRQSDKKFIDLLNKIRLNKINSEDLDELNNQVKEDVDNDDGTIVLCPTNRKVDDINNSNLYQLKTPTFHYEAIVKGKWSDKEFPVKKEIILKVGAQVMITKNDTETPKRWVNGTLGTVTFLSENQIKVKIKDKIFTIGKVKWDKYSHLLSGNKVTTTSIGSFIQFPIKLAWATTIHKSQGQTFDKVAIDLDTGSFAHGQTYVALSRAKNLKGITLLKKINKKDIIFNNRVLEFIGQKLKKKYIKEITENKMTEKKVDNSSKNTEWSKSEDNKLMALYKRNVPEFALSKILKKSLPQIRERIMTLMKK